MEAIDAEGVQTHARWLVMAAPLLEFLDIRGCAHWAVELKGFNSLSVCPISGSGESRVNESLRELNQLESWQGPTSASYIRLGLCRRMLLSLANAVET